MPANSPIWKGLPSGDLIETAGSAKLKLAERITYVQQFKGRYADAYSFALAHPRGSVWTLSIGLCEVEDTSLESETGAKGTVTVNYLYLGLTPPDEFALTAFEINPPIEKHAFFSTLTQDDRKKARMIFTAQSSAAQTTLSAAAAASVNNVLIVNLINKLLKGEETFYLAGFKFQHTLYFFTPPNASEGGFLETPFGAFASYVAGSGLSWLRQADELCWSNGIWKLTRTWIGAPAGNWDTDLYPAA